MTECSRIDQAPVLLSLRTQRGDLWGVRRQAEASRGDDGATPWRYYVEGGSLPEQSLVLGVQQGRRTTATVIRNRKKP